MGSLYNEKTHQLHDFDSQSHSLACQKLMLTSTSGQLWTEVMATLATSKGRQTTTTTGATQEATPTQGR